MLFANNSFTQQTPESTNPFFTSVNVFWDKNQCGYYPITREETISDLNLHLSSKLK